MNSNTSSVVKKLTDSVSLQESRTCAALKGVARAGHVTSGLALAGSRESSSVGKTVAGSRVQQSHGDVASQTGLFAQGHAHGAVVVDGGGETVGVAKAAQVVWGELERNACHGRFLRVCIQCCGDVS